MGEIDDTGRPIKLGDAVDPNAQQSLRSARNSTVGDNDSIIGLIQDAQKTRDTYVYIACDTASSTPLESPVTVRLEAAQPGNKGGDRV